MINRTIFGIVTSDDRNQRIEAAIQFTGFNQFKINVAETIMNVKIIGRQLVDEFSQMKEVVLLQNKRDNLIAKRLVF